MQLRNTTIAVSLAVLTATTLAGCSQGDTGSNAGLQIDPPSADVQSGAVLKFDAVTDGVLDGIVWSVEEAGGGAIDTEGRYTAPDQEGTYHVIASLAGPSSPRVQAEVRVWKHAPVVVSPGSASVAAGGTAQFAASGSATASGVIWSIVEGTAGGSITGGGLYTAPTTAGSYHVLATSTSDPARTGVATVEVSAPTSAPSTSPPGVVAAFPGAQGGGALSKGGRGGAVYLVTNLNDSGSGSLRACVQASGPRTCVFRVSGPIVLQSGMTVTNPYLTVAGQTAPGGGIALVIKPGVTPANQRIFRVATHDVIIRYLRCWGDYIPGDDPNPNGNGSYCVNVTDNSTGNVIVDHMSMLWQSGKAWQLWNAAGKTTVQWSILGEEVIGDNQGQSTPAGSGNDSADPTRIQDTDFHHNLFASASHRFPELTSGTGRIINNVIYNWGWTASVLDTGGNLDFIGNHYKPGPINPDSGHREIMLSSAGRLPMTLYVNNNRSDWNGPSYSPDNGSRGVISGNETDGGWSKIVGGTSAYQGTQQTAYTPLSSSFKRSARLASPGIDITPDPVSNLQALLTAAGGVGASRQLDCNGNWINTRDSADARVVANFVNGTGQSSIPSSAVNANGGSLPRLAAGSPCTDADGDGMPDAWETAHGLNPNDPSDASVVNPDGYTNLEHFLNGQ